MDEAVKTGSAAQRPPKGPFINPVVALRKTDGVLLARRFSADAAGSLRRTIRPLRTSSADCLAAPSLPSRLRIAQLHRVSAALSKPCSDTASLEPSYSPPLNLKQQRI